MTDIVAGKLYLVDELVEFARGHWVVAVVVLVQLLQVIEVAGRELRLPEDVRQRAIVHRVIHVVVEDVRAAEIVADGNPGLDVVGVEWHENELQVAAHDWWLQVVEKNCVCIERCGDAESLAVFLFLVGPVVDAEGGEFGARGYHDVRDGDGKAEVDDDKVARHGL